MTTARHRTTLALFLWVGASLAGGCGPGNSGPADGSALDMGRDSATGDPDAATRPDMVAVEPRLIAVARDGRIASLDIAAPWSVRATAGLGATAGSARCRGGRCVIVHPSPADSLHVVSATDLSVLSTVSLEAGSDPRDAALLDDGTAVVSQHGRAALLVIDLGTGQRTTIDLAALADADGLPEAHRLATCGRRVFAQLRRMDHDTGLPAALPAVLAVIDLDRAGPDRVVDADANTPGVQGITLADRPDFDMPVDCGANRLYVAEPKPLFKGGGRYQQVDLAALKASDLPIEIGAEVGGFEYVAPGLFWIITHTDIGPGPSSHLNQIGGPVNDTYNTFASEHVNDLVLDAAQDLLFFPDPCQVHMFPSCDGGIQVFRARAGTRETVKAIHLDFPPIEVTVAR